MISDHISDDIPPQMKILNMVIPIHSNTLPQFPLKLKRCKPHKAPRLQKKCDVISDVKLFSDNISQDILSQIFYVIQSDMALSKAVH